MTQEGWRWPRVPYASSNAGATDYRGADGFLYAQRPNVGELGFGYLRLYKMTGNAAYRQAEVRCADALAQNVREGDVEHSPWPFRVNEETGVVREEYSANVIGPIKLFSELIRLEVADVPAYERARSLAWNWMMKYPMQNDAWSGYFEDVYQFDRPVNYHQYSAMETARYLMQHPVEDLRGPRPATTPTNSERSKMDLRSRNPCSAHAKNEFQSHRDCRIVMTLCRVGSRTLTLPIAPVRYFSPLFFRHLQSIFVSG